MTRRDVAWRVGGVALLGIAAAGAILQNGRGDDPAASSYGLPVFIVAILGTLLLVQGRRVAMVLRAERRGHPLTARAIHAGRLRRSAARPRLDRRR